MHTEQNVEVFSRESFPAPSSFTFPFLSSPLLLLFFPGFFPFFCEHLLGFLLVGKGFAKNSGIVNIFGRKYEWVAGQEFFNQSYTVFFVFLWPV